MLKNVAVALIGLALASCASLVTPKPNVEPAALKAGDYRLDPRHASIVFKIDHLGFSTYVGRFETFDATLTFAEDDPAAAAVEAVVDMTSLDVADDPFAETLLGEKWFDAETYPEAVFRSTAITVTGDNTGRIDGELTLKGVSAPVSLDAVFNGGARDLLRSAYVVGFSAAGEIDRTAFGVDQFAGVITETVRLEIEAEFTRE